VTFAEVAQRFGVSRERVRQWQLKFLPDAPRGHRRRRLCLIENCRRQLLADPLFRAFYRHARAHFHRRDVLPVSGGSGFRKRVVRLHGRVVAIKSARPIPRGNRSVGPSYALTNAAASVDFIYYQLADAEFLVVPRDLIPSTGTTFLDTGTSRYQPYRNTFAAVHVASQGCRQDVEAGNNHHPDHHPGDHPDHHRGLL
jgi:hypothetical protein